MPTQPVGADQALERYLVELRRPDAGWGELQLLAARARRAAELLRAEGTPVRFLRSVFLPEDDACLFLYEAPSDEAVGEAVRRAALAIERVSVAVRAD
jgi:Protein of unknown function (DUF4242)